MEKYTAYSEIDENGQGIETFRLPFGTRVYARHVKREPGGIYVFVDEDGRKCAVIPETIQLEAI